MKTITNNVALAFSFFICLSNLPFLNVTRNIKLVTETCQKVKNKNLSLSSLMAERATQDAPDITTLALIAIKIASNNGSSTSVYIKKSLVDGNIKELTILQNFEDCSENFGGAMQELDDALAFIVSRDYQKVKPELGSAIADATTCVSMLDKRGGKNSELSNKTNTFRELCTIALDIVNILAPK